MRKALFRVCLTFAFLWTSSAESGGPVVSTRYGSLKGTYSRVKGTDKVVHGYLGIPFAKPPVGALRLSAPQPPEPWEGLRDATKQPSMCIQDVENIKTGLKEIFIDFPVLGISEDCLYLNIHTPANPSEEAKLPVMVWIHGGGLRFGAASLYDGSVLAAYEDVLVVVIQYRLGPLGFLSTGDEHAKGNWGFLDQIAALQWVQENIKSFGGDPGSVTLFGESAGGISVSTLILSPLTSGLFHRAIPQSGVALLPMFFTSNPLPGTKVFAKGLGCDDSDSEQIVKCVMQKTEEEILKAPGEENVIFGTVDGVFLPHPVENLFQDKVFHKVPILLGVTNHEGGWLLPNIMAPPGWEKGLDKEQLMAILKKIFRSEITGQEMLELIADEYLGQTEDPEEIRNAFTEILGDMIMVVPTVKVANFHKEAGVPVYLYEYQHRPSLYKDTRPSFVKADHSDEIGFVFGGCFWNGEVKIKGTVTEEEVKLCRTMMAYWANFARNGSPNGEGLEPWPQYGKDEEYLALGLQQKTARRLKEDRVKFMTQTLPAKLKALREQSTEHPEL
ncbi:carboxylesterase 3 [Lepisosteus oculatus]|uniref:carboxylesterase 3 n=1 Tax=Lepisosteus oculatus TaxID=7918 RepID=UPI0035F50676